MAIFYLIFIFVRDEFFVPGILFVFLPYDAFSSFYSCVDGILHGAGMRK